TAEEHRLVGLVARGRRQERDDLIDVADVAEGVERQLEGLSAQDQVARDRWLALLDRTVLADPAEVEQHALVVEDLVAALLVERDRDRQPRQLQRPAAD